MNQPENLVQVSNRQAYFSPRVLRSYSKPGLMCDEAAVLLKYQPFFAGQDVLDIGIGAGRTTAFLEPLARTYVGIDFSPVFIEFVNSAMPAVRAKLCDMRDLGEFGTATFDFAMASFNVIDFVNHQDRIKTLAEVRRVLRPSGLFVFSSHNRLYKFAGRRPTLEVVKDPVRQVRQIARWVGRMRNYLRWKKHWIRTAEYDIISDIGNDYSTLHYYIDQYGQRRQLQEAGFEVVDVYGTSGTPVESGDPDPDSGYLTYVVRKSSRASQ